MVRWKLRSMLLAVPSARTQSHRWHADDGGARCASDARPHHGDGSPSAPTRRAVSAGKFGERETGRRTTEKEGTQTPLVSPCATAGSDGQSCFPAGLRGPVFLGFSLALINSGVPPLPPCPFGPCPTPPLPREPGPCILGPFPPPATLGVPPEAGLWNLRVCHSSLRLCGALRTLDSGFCASNSGALCWRPSGLRTVDSGWVAEGMARSPDSGFWIV